MEANPRRRSWGIASMPRCPCASWKGKPVDTQLDAGPWHGSRSHLGKALVDVVSDPLRKNLTLMCACQTQAISTSATLRRSASGNSGSHLQHHLATATSDDNHLGFRSSTLRRLCGRQRSSTPLAQPSIHLFEQPTKAASTSAYPSPTPSNHRQTNRGPLSEITCHSRSPSPHRLGHLVGFRLLGPSPSQSEARRPPMSACRLLPSCFAHARPFVHSVCSPAEGGIWHPAQPAASLGRR